MRTVEVQVTGDRKESVPLAVAFVCFLEKMLLTDAGPGNSVCFAGQC